MRQKLTLLTKSLLLLCALIAGSGSAWAEETTIASFDATDYNGGTTNGWSVSNSDYATSSKGNYYKLISNDGKITTPSINWSGYTGITITITARTFGGSSADQKKISVSQGSTELNSYSPGSTSLVASSALSISPSGTGSLTIACLSASSSKGSAVSSIIIKGTVNSSDPSSSVSFANATPSIDLKDGNTYTQAASTATGYTGTVTYSITANTAGASINESTGEVTATQAGSVTVQATAPAVTGWASSTATYTLTVNDTRVATTTTIVSTGITNTDVNSSTAAGSLSANVTETTSGDAVAGATVTWTSSNPSVATIDEDGNVTLVAKGTTTITATYAGTTSYKTSSDTYALTVTNSGIVNIDLNNTFFGTSYSGSLSTDDKKALKNGTGYVEGTANNVNVKFYINESSNFYINDAQIRVYDGTSILVTAPTGYALTSVAFVEPSSGTAWTGTHTSSPTGYDDSSKSWTGVASAVEVTFGGTCRVVGLEVTLSSTVPVTITSAKYATYCGAIALDFSSTGITAYTATDGETKVTLNEIESGKVPANTPVVLYKAGADGTAINVPVTASADAVEGTNDLHVSTGTDVDYMYVLANKSGVVGFYPWGGTNLSAGKIYLQGKASYGARSFIGFDDVTAVGSMKALPAIEGAYYNLNGQQVAQPAKGLYIVNGKKIVIK